MKSRQKWRLEEATAASSSVPVAPSSVPVAPSSSDEEGGSDAETNFSLLTGRDGGKAGNSRQTKEEEPNSDEEDEGSVPAEEQSGEEEDNDEEDGDSEASDDDDDDEGDEHPDGGGGSTEIRTREDIKKELSNMSFEDILKLQSKVGTRVFNEVAYGSQQPEGGQKKKKKRLNKNRPTEVSTKRPAPFLRQVVPVRKAMFRDPRFDDLSGEYKREIFEKTYKFIDDIKQREKETVQKQLKKTKNEGRKEKLAFLLKRMENQERAKKNRDQQRERELQFRKQQRERADQGARPFFLKKSEKKKLQLADKYEQLKKSGKLENFLSKKRKRNAMKDRRKLPEQQSRKTT